MKKKICFAGLVLLWSAGAAGAPVVYDWGELSRAGRLAGGEVVTIDGRTALKVVNTNQSLARVPVLKTDKPGIEAKRYVVRGEVKYENVAGDGYLEMWSSFEGRDPEAPEQKFFSRTLGESGEMGKLSGSSDWRRFALPFDRTGTAKGPTQLEINVVLPGPGTVYLGALRREEASSEDFRRDFGFAGGWWSGRAAGMIGGIGGGVIGVLASALTWLAAKGKARRFVLTMTGLLIGIGVLCAAGTVVALATRQPFWVWSVPGLCGLLLLLIMPARFRQYQKLYEDLELRRMKSVDAGKVLA